MSNPVDHLKKLAKGLLKQTQGADPIACARARHIYSDYRDVPDAALSQQLTLGRAQHIIAVEHGFQSWEGVASATPLALYLAITMAKYPALNYAGHGLIESDRNKPRDERAAILHRERFALIANVERVGNVVDWLREYVTPIKTMNSKRTSYGMKHVAEKDVGYITNGVFVAAGLIAGYAHEFRPDSLNVLFGMSERSFQRIEADRVRNSRPYGWRVPGWGQVAYAARVLTDEAFANTPDPRT